MSTALLEFSNNLADTVERAGRSVVSVNEGGRAGVSGTIWRDGLVVTAEHTIRDQEELTIGLPAGGSSSATVVGRDPTTDIALLRLKDRAGTPIEPADAAQLRVGHFVLSIGRRSNHAVAASHGIISAIGGAWRTGNGGRIDQSYRLDLLPFTGFSGGPLVDSQSRAIGINTSGPRRTVMTVPASTVNRVVDQLLAKGRIARGYVGVALQPVPLPANIRSAAGSSGGLLIIMVEAGGPAEKAGLMIGDIVIALGDKAISDPADLQAALDPEQIGKAVVLRVLRGGKAQDVPVTVGELAE